MCVCKRCLRDNDEYKCQQKWTLEVLLNLWSWKYEKEKCGKEEEGNYTGDSFTIVLTIYTLQLKRYSLELAVEYNYCLCAAEMKGDCM